MASIACLVQQLLGMTGQDRAEQGRAGQTDRVDISEAASVVDLLEHYIHGWDAALFLPQSNLHNSTTWGDGRQCCLQQQSDMPESVMCLSIACSSSRSLQSIRCLVRIGAIKLSSNMPVQQMNGSCRSALSGEGRTWQNSSYYIAV